jgi:DNA (cytosine-5)-methyltransferase 1
MGRVANGIPRRMDRLKQLGNAVVPQIPEIIGNAILEVEGYNRNVQCN